MEMKSEKIARDWSNIFNYYYPLKLKHHYMGWYDSVNELYCICMKDNPLSVSEFYSRYRTDPTGDPVIPIFKGPRTMSLDFGGTGYDHCKTFGATGAAQL